MRLKRRAKIFEIATACVTGLTMTLWGGYRHSAERIPCNAEEKEKKDFALVFTGRQLKCVYNCFALSDLAEIRDN